MSSGCRVLLIIGTVISAIIIVGIILSYVFCGQITEALVNKTVETLESQVLADLPESYDAEQVKQKFETFKESVKRQIKNNNLDADEINKLSTQVQQALQDKEISKEELDEIMKLIDDVIQTE